MTANTSIVDLGATLAAVATGVAAINTAASGMEGGAANVQGVVTALDSLATAGESASTSITNFQTSVSSAMSSAGTAIRGAGLSSAMSSMMSGVVSSANIALNTLRNAFWNARLRFNPSELKLPHFTMAGSFNAQTGSVPTVSVHWYQRAAELGAIFDRPQIIGVGDADQREILLGEDRLKELLGGNREPQVVNYITVNGAEDPEKYANRLARQLKLQLRMG